MINFDADAWKKTKTLQAGEFVKLPAGGYVCIVINANIESSRNNNLQLVLTLDIAEGEFAQMFRSANYPPKLYQSVLAVNNAPSPYFKGLIQNFIDSNTGYYFDGGNFDEKILIGKKIGIIFRDEQREWNDKIYTDAKPYRALSIDKIRSGDFTVPPMKAVEKSPAVIAAEKSFDEEFVGEEISDESVPF